MARRGVARPLLLVRKVNCRRCTGIRSLLLLLAGSAPAVVIAEQAVASVDSDGFVPFGVIDSDNNGYVSRVEARSLAGVEEVFSAADANGDGLLDRDEYRRVRTGLELQQQR